MAWGSVQGRSKEGVVQNIGPFAAAYAAYIWYACECAHARKRVACTPPRGPCRRISHARHCPRTFSSCRPVQRPPAHPPTCPSTPSRKAARICQCEFSCTCACACVCVWGGGGSVCVCVAVCQVHLRLCRSAHEGAHATVSHCV